MKKLIFLLGIVIGSLSARSQVSFSASPSTVNSGNIVTLTSSGETSDAYLSNVASVTTNNPNVTASINTTNYGFGATGTPTTITVTISYPSGTGALPVTLTVNSTLYYPASGNSYSDPINATPTVNVNPAVLNPTTYWNVAESGTFIDQSCGTGSMGSAVIYTVAAHTYSSTSSQAAANQLAINSVNANGQSYANTHGTCTAVYARIEGTVNDGEGSNLVVHFYTNAACTTPLALPSSTSITVTWSKYYTDGTPYTINSVWTVAQGASTFYMGHREFYPTIPPPVVHVDWVASVVLQSNPNYTNEPNYGIFTNN